MAASKSMKFFLPGLFLLFLGSGNICVGVLKAYQYDHMLAELEAHENDPELDAMAPLERIQVDNQPEARIYRSISYAQARKDFYDLVTLGGELFVLASAILLTISAFLRIRQPVALNQTIPSVSQP